MTPPRHLLDTNVLLYPHDAGDEARQSRAGEVLRWAGAGSRAAVPAQALAEFANVALTKFQPGLDPSDVYEQIESFERSFPILPLTSAIVLEAVRGVREYQLSYFDAQIWAAAKLNQIPVVLSEDFNVGAVLEGVTFMNPLDPAFDLD